MPNGKKAKVECVNKLIKIVFYCCVVFCRPLFFTLFLVSVCFCSHLYYRLCLPLWNLKTFPVKHQPSDDTCDYFIYHVSYISDRMKVGGPLVEFGRPKCIVNR